jgi:hypothetical protein
MLHTTVLQIIQRHTGWLILATLLLFLGSKIFPVLFPAVAFLAWLVVLVEWNRLAPGSRKQACFLLAIGFLALLFAAAHGIFPGWQKILSANLQLLPMFVAVSFLSLTNPATEDSYLPTGKRAVLTTALGTNLLGAVINLSILFVFGDRLQRHETLTRSQSILLARTFCAAAWWSPFFIATGVAFTYAPEMEYHRTLVPGILMCLMAITYTVIEVGFVRRAEFTGYPLRVESLAVPVLLATAVIAGHHFFPTMSVLLLICLVSPPAAILLMRGRPRLLILHDFISNRITSTVSQFVLFLAAGVFATGITTLTQVYPEVFNFAGQTFTTVMFATVSGVLIVLGLIGVHPVVGISIVSPLLLPLHPDHSQLGFLFLTSWAISTGSSPLSGFGLVLTSRYHVSPKAVLISNFHYVVVTWLLATYVNVLFFA